MSACRITRMKTGVYPAPPRYAAAVAEALEATAGGPAAGVRWDLSDLYAGADDPRIEADLAAALAQAESFAARWRGRLADAKPTDLAAAVDELERIQEPVA